MPQNWALKIEKDLPFGWEHTSCTWATRNGGRNGDKIHIDELCHWLGRLRRGTTLYETNQRAGLPLGFPTGEVWKNQQLANGNWLFPLGVVEWSRVGGSANPASMLVPAAQVHGPVYTSVGAGSESANLAPGFCGAVEPAPALAPAPAPPAPAPPAPPAPAPAPAAAPAPAPFSMPMEMENSRIDSLMEENQFTAITFGTPAPVTAPGFSMVPGPQHQGMYMQGAYMDPFPPSPFSFPAAPAPAPPAPPAAPAPNAGMSNWLGGPGPQFYTDQFGRSNLVQEPVFAPYQYTPPPPPPPPPPASAYTSAPAIVSAPRQIQQQQQEQQQEANFEYQFDPNFDFGFPELEFWDADEQMMDADADADAEAEAEAPTPESQLQLLQQLQPQQQQRQPESETLTMEELDALWEMGVGADAEDFDFGSNLVDWEQCA
ncbi:hypothetical protein ACEQ8H_002166 [Pleosporales sp. CAS-2024a]